MTELVYRNRTERCPCGIALFIRCPNCSPYADDEPAPLDPKTTRRKASLRFRIGETVAGVRILARDIDAFRALCECGEEFDVSRTTIANHARRGTMARCWPCVKRESGKSSSGTSASGMART